MKGRMAAAAGLCLFLFSAFAMRPDALAALTIYPAWVIAVVGLASTGLLCWRTSDRLTAVLLAVWLAFLLAYSEEPWAVLSSGQPQGKERGAIRVASLNWGGAGREPLAELAALTPDIMLIQESPRAEILDELAALIGGSGVYGPEASIVSRGRSTRIEQSAARSVFCQKAEVTLGSAVFRIVSLRLRPPLVRFDLWNPACWSDYREAQAVRRDQLRQAVEGLGPSTIVGGDFNVPAGDGVVRLLSPAFQDAFKSRGRGFGNTAPSSLAVHRIDQIWVARDLKVLDSFAAAIAGSDHRAVVVDLVHPRSSAF